jgi:hypothetical protein
VGRAIGSMHGLRSSELRANGIVEGVGQQGRAIMVALAIANHDQALIEIDVLDTKFAALGDTKSSAINELCHQLRCSAHRAEQRGRLSAFPELEWLGINGLPATDEIVPVLMGLKKLKFIEMNGTRITSASNQG